jgi:flavin reductase (DIM6/NTAB) family NADH-FMN oxidoreductase RutF
MKRRPIDFPEFQVQPYSLLARQWLVLTCGDLKTGRYNSMTVGWGSFGVMWNKPFVQVVVRPTRYTYEFMNRYPTFTLCALGKKYREALQILGTRSGRDGNKIAETGLTPIPSTKVAAPGFNEAQLILELKKMYWEDFRPENFLDPAIEELYPQKDYHRLFYGEILAIQGTGEYSII